MLLTELLYGQRTNQKMAVKHGLNSISFLEWYNQSYFISKLIDEEISTESKNIGIFLPNSIEYAIAYFAILFSNKVIVPIGTQSKSPEILSTLDYCEIDLIITKKEFESYISHLLKAYDYRITLFFIDNSEFSVINPKADIIKKLNSMDFNNNEHDVAILLHTSGTTSNPKRVMLTHDNLISNIISNIESLKLTEKDKVLISMPMYFGYCNTAQFLTHLFLGASIVILDGIFLPKLFFQTIDNEQITNFTGVPSILLMLLLYRHVNKYNISSLRYICFGGGKMPIDKLEILIEKFDTVGFVHTYGQTEASPRITALLPVDSIKKIGSVGRPIPNVKVKIIDDNGNELKANKIGEIVTKGKNIMKGYYQQAEITKKTIKNEWLYTGDLGYIDNDGYLYITGRKKNIIISGGINVYPEEVEEILMRHFNVEEVYVFAENHNLLGEVPVAKIVTKDAQIVDNDFSGFCKKYLAKYKIPIRFDLVSELKKTYNGKIRRSEK